MSCPAIPPSSRLVNAPVACMAVAAYDMKGALAAMLAALADAAADSRTA